MPENSTLLLFGATGDLAQRMLLPSLYNLHCDGLIAPALCIVATARTDQDTVKYIAFADAALQKHLAAGLYDGAKAAEFYKRISYVALDASNPDNYGALGQAVGLTGTLAIFLSTAPSLFEATIAGLSNAGLAHERAVIGLEKPLGIDLASSRIINDAVRAAYPEERTFRIDHYLGKETVQNLLALRFGNSLFEPLWNADGIDHVQITVSETVGLEGRVSFYDGAGALRDMVQNHMLQLLSLVAMEPPSTFDATAIRDEKVKILRSLRKIDRATVASHSVIGQYTGGASTGAIVSGYAEELTKPSTTETFVALKAHIDNWRWKGVPFYMRTGKRLPARRSEIQVQFKPVPHNIFGQNNGQMAANKLLIQLQPEENIRLQLMTKEPGLDREGIKLREVPLDLSLKDAFAGSRRRIAYERLLLDLIEGDQTLFVRRDEVEAQWQWVDSIRDGWKNAGMTPKPYPAGTWGPNDAVALAVKDGVSWHD
jgi:glucose-6-phosphate 1-dehydrogenase